MPEMDWEAVKTEYVTTNISKTKLAEKYGLPHGQVQYRSMAEQWGELRRRHRDKIMAKTSDRLSDEAAERMARLMGSTDKLMDAALQALDDPEQFYRYIVKEKEDGETYTREVVLDKADTKAMKDMGTVLEKLTGLTRDLYGLPDREQELREQLARQKLEQARSDADRSIEVVLGGELEAWSM